MGNFGRAVREALRYRFQVTAIVVSSLLVAVLWGGNIGTIYPFVEVSINGQSMHGWIDGKIKSSRTTINELEAQIQQAPDDPESAKQQRNDRSSLRAEREALARYERIRPFVKRYTPASPFYTLLFIVCVLLVGTLLKNIFLGVNLVLVEWLAQLTTFGIRKQFFRQTLAMDLDSFGDDHTTGLVARFTHDLSFINGGLNNLFGRTVREPLKMLACLIGAGLICWRLLLLSLIVAPIAGLVIRTLARSIKRANRKAMEQMAELYAVITESLSGIEAVKTFTMERHERRRLHQAAKLYMRRAMRIATYNAMMRPATELMGIGAVCMAILAGGYLALSDGATSILGIPIASRPLDRGALLTFFALLIGVSDPARKLADVYGMIQRGAAAADRVYQMMDRTSKIQEPARPQPLPEPLGNVVLEKVTFGYLEDQTVLQDVSLELKRGETLAIVGPNGCGKSTLAKLIPRLYDPRSGSVQISGIDVRDVRLADLRSRIGVVTQNTWLFDDTVGNNLRYGSLHASAEEVRQAAAQAHADRFINQLANGYDTPVGERGGKLSGGQRQRLALARAILRDPEILILDEATSQVDLESEQLIHDALRKFVRGRTTIMITHRLSTLELADRILVLDDGRVTDLGTHDELIGRCRLYGRLHEAGLRQSA